MHRISRFAFALAVGVVGAGFALLSSGCVVGEIEGSEYRRDGGRGKDTGLPSDEDTGEPTPDEDAEPPPEDSAGPPPKDTGAPPPPPEDTGAPPPPPDTGPPPSTYPPGPYGKTTGAVMPNLKWKGYRDSTGPWTDITLGDYYDPTGSKGIRAIWLGLAAVW